MTPDISSSESSLRYLNSCKRYDVDPNPRVLSWFHQAKIQKSTYQARAVVIILDYLKDADFCPLLDALEAVGSSPDIDSFDIIQQKGSTCDKKLVWSLVLALKSKLRVLQLGDTSLVNDFLRNSSMNGLSCQVVNIMSSNIPELKLEGKFKYLHTLNLDFCTSLKNLPKDCFTSVPKLMRLSMCGTSVANLWSASEALSKLSSLVELRFQNCLCCEGTGPCSASGREYSNLVFNRTRSGNVLTSSVLEQSTDEPNEVSIPNLGFQDSLDSPTSVINPNFYDTSTPSKKYISAHPSPICFEKHYRVFLINSISGLAVLDNLEITKSERENSKIIISENYEHLPYKRRLKQSVVTLLHQREGGLSRINHRDSKRSLCSAKFGSSTRPLSRSLSRNCHVTKEERKNLTPRQFEYHPTDPRLMVFGTMDGEIVVINHENKNIVGYISSDIGDNSVLGLCWLKKYPNVFLAGSDNGSLRLYDINHMKLKTAKGYENTFSITFDNYEQLTSVHINSTDDWFLTSGCSGNVALYDIDSGKRVHLFNGIHRGPVNVAKFANHSPSMFATSSFDRDVKMWDVRQNLVRPCYTVSSSGGNVMVCFSPDDHHLLVSAVDNELGAQLQKKMNFSMASRSQHRSGKNKSNPETGRDRVSSLPDILLVHILSFLPTTIAFRTSVLSTRWQYLWTLVLVLDFSPYFTYPRKDPDSRFTNFIQMILLQHSKNVKRFFIQYPREYDCSRLYTWTNALLKHNIQDAAIFCSGMNFRLPRNFFICKTLEKLKLECQQLYVPSSIHFPCLKILSVCVDASNRDFSERLFCSAPMLEELSIFVTSDNGAKIYNISSSYLKKLIVEITAAHIKDFDIKVIVDAPALETLDIMDNCFADYVLKIHHP